MTTCLPLPWQAMGNMVRRLCVSNATLFTALLLLNALAQPYAGLVHDSRLYAVQVLNRTQPELYADDLYLRYGSQDSYSLFSWIADPAVRVLGVRPAFFLLYLASNALFLFAMQRFVLAIVRRRATAALALIYLAVNPVPFGGLDTFHVNESFMTPRLAAVGLVLLALAQLPRQRLRRSLLLLVPALLLHPIMAFGGLLVWLYVAGVSHLSRGQLITVVIGCGCLVLLVLAWFPLGAALLGHMDSAWREPVQAANPYSTPLAWSPRDWVRIALAFAIAVAARLHSPMPPTRRLLDGMIAVAGLGLGVGVAASYLPYALLFQGQAYRALWLLQLAQFPLGFLLVRRWWFGGAHSHRASALLLAGLMAVTVMTVEQVLSIACLIAICRLPRLAWHGPRRWCLAPAAVLLAAGVVSPVAVPLVASGETLGQLLAPWTWPQLVPSMLGPLYTWLFALALIAVLYRGMGPGNRFRAAAIGLFLVVQSASFGSNLLGVANAYFHCQQDMAFVKRFIQRRYGPSARPTIYWPVPNLEDVWLGLKAKSYYSIQQTAGSMFNRGTAMEGQRRAHVVRAFEIEENLRWRPLISSAQDESLRDVFGVDPQSVVPTLEDLDRLCRDETVDLAVVRHRFNGFYSDTNGRCFIYECPKIRQAVRREVAAQAARQIAPPPSAARKSSGRAGCTERAASPTARQAEKSPSAMAARPAAP